MKKKKYPANDKIQMAGDYKKYRVLASIKVSKA
jgi:hypothetical protein